ncbi:MAG: SPOR domain-containing protein [Candidatus Eutrophobiaceae bacterium]
MSRDYKNIHVKPPAGAATPRRIHILSFSKGLAIGLIVALIAWRYQPPAEIVVEKVVVAEQQDCPSIPIEPEYAFYQCLRKGHSNWSEWPSETIETKATAADADDAPAPAMEEKEGTSNALPSPTLMGSGGGFYVLQVGSYENHTAAIKMKARIELLDIRTDIQRMVLDESQTVYRVRTAPYTDQPSLHDAEHRLAQQGIEYQTLRIGDRRGISPSPTPEDRRKL